MKLIVDNEFESLIPPLSEEELDELEHSIFKHGCRDALVVWKGKNILLDGHHRYHVCSLNTIPFAVKEIELESREDAMDWIIRNQFGRRNLSNYERCRLVLKLEAIISAKAKEHMSLGGKGCQISDKPIDTKKELAKVARVSHDTIHRVKKIEEKATPEQKHKLQIGEASINEVFKELSKAEKAARKEAKRQELIEKAEQVDPDGIVEIIHGDFRDVCRDIAAESIDLVLTDPPYPKEYLPLWNDLAEMAARVLKPSGFCIAYSGQLHLFDVGMMMRQHLDYYWTSALYHQGPTQLIHARNVICEWKPILIFYKPPFRKLERQWSDYVVSPAREKGLHDWQQSEVPYEYLIDFFSEPGNLVLDPCTGGGTVPVVCRRKKRRCIAVDIEEENVRIARGRLADQQ
jgi:16S rRNA G966 N2-methylase RsmD